MLNAGHDENIGESFSYRADILSMFVQALLLLRMRKLLEK